MRLDLNQLKELYETKVQESLRRRRRAGRRDASARSWSSPALRSLVLLLAFGVAARSARAREELMEALDQALHEDAERNELEARLQRSLEMAHAETTVVPARRPGDRASVPRASLRSCSSPTPAGRTSGRSAHRRCAGGPGCPVMSPADCPAATWGQTQIWTSSTALDACPVPPGPAGRASAPRCACRSASAARPSASSTRPPPTKQPPRRSRRREDRADRPQGRGSASGCCGRSMRSETQAHTDPLTGLMNRRSLEVEVRGLSEDGHYLRRRVRRPRPLQAAQ